MGKTLLALNNAEVPSHYDYEYFRDKAPLLKVLPTLGWILPLGGLGLILGWRRRHLAAPVLFLAVLLSVVPFFITARYRLPLAVFLLPATGLAVQAIWSHRRSTKDLGWLGGVAVLYAVLAYFPLFSGGLVQAHMLNVEGTALVQSGNLKQGRRAFEKALEVNPNHAEAINNLAYTYVLEGDLTTALAHYRRAIAIAPTQAETYLNIEDIHRKAGRNQEAMDVLAELLTARRGVIDDVAATVAYRRGVNVLALGDTTASLAYLEDGVRQDPNLLGAWLNLATMYRKTSRPQDAVEATTRAVVIAPDAQAVQVAHGTALSKVGRWEEATRAFQQGVAIGPPSAELYFRLGSCLRHVSKNTEAEQYLIAANKGQPHHGALWELGQLYEQDDRIDDALTAYQALVRVGAPQTADARQRIQDLRARKGK
jgi:tetratricopeptide (TPR) repeat protein